MYDVVTGALGGKQVLDIGTGSGVLGLLAALHGAAADAIDIDPVAVCCAAYNARENRLPLNVWQSDMFASVPAKKYDLILANLPILPQEHACIALFDPSYKAHKTLFARGREYLSPAGSICLTTADLIPRGFSNIEKMARGYDARVLWEEKDLGHTWRTYQFTRR